MLTFAMRRAVRTYATRSRFYERVGVYGDGRYEVTLDRRRLKTPAGGAFSVNSEPLALAVANEWDAQTDIVDRSSMHLTSLCSTVLDNPNELSKIDVINYMVNHLTTDTLLFQSQDENALYDLQRTEWDPVIQWFCDKFHVDIKKTTGIEAPAVSLDTKSTLVRHFQSYNFAAINGLVFGIDTLKSVILMLAAVNRYILPEKAVYLSRLEEEFQTSYWGKVTWSHDLNQNELQSRLCAALLFINFNSFQLQNN